MEVVRGNEVVFMIYMAEPQYAKPLAAGANLILSNKWETYMVL